jgi:hypothetical protein
VPESRRVEQAEVLEIARPAQVQAPGANAPQGKGDLLKVVAAEGALRAFAL